MNERRNSGGPIPRPQTSNGNRREASRPRTSHDRRPDMGRSPPPPQPQGGPVPPGKDSPEMNYQQTPVPRPQGGIHSPRMRPSGPAASRGTAPPGPPPQPPMNQDRPRSGPVPYGIRNNYKTQKQYDAQGQYPPPDPRRNNDMHEEGYASDHVPQSRAHITPVDRATAVKQYQSTRQQDSHSNSFRSLPDAYGARTQRESNGVPNSYTIPTHVNEKSEDNLIGNQQPNFDENVYRKPTYQSPGAFPGLPEQIDTQQSQPSPPNQTTSSLAEFSFDLPSGNQSVTASRSGIPAQGAPYRGGYDARIPSSRAVPTGYGNSPPQDPPAGPYAPQMPDSRTARIGYGYNQPQELPAGQYPPRAASRNGMKPTMEIDAPRPPVPKNVQPFRSFRQDQYSKAMR